MTIKAHWTLITLNSTHNPNSLTIYAYFAPSSCWYGSAWIAHWTIWVRNCAYAPIKNLKNNFNKNKIIKVNSSQLKWKLINFDKMHLTNQSECTFSRCGPIFCWPPNRCLRQSKVEGAWCCFLFWIVSLCNFLAAFLYLFKFFCMPLFPILENVFQNSSIFLSSGNL